MSCSLRSASRRLETLFEDRSTNGFASLSLVVFKVFWTAGSDEIWVPTDTGVLRLVDCVECGDAMVAGVN